MSGLLTSITCIHAGLYDVAKMELGNFLKNVLPPGSLSTKAQALAWLAMAEAAAGDEFSARLDQAIYIADQSENLDSPIRVRALAGSVLQRMQNKSDARKLYAQALNLVRDRPERTDGFYHSLALIGIQECTEYAVDMTARSLELVTKALGNSITWWLLERLLRALNRGHVNRCVNVVRRRPPQPSV